MAHYAVLDSTLTVTQVFVGRDDVVEGIDNWEAYYAPEGSTVKQTSYNTYGGVHSLGGTPLRKNYAGIGFTYDEELDAFIPPSPYPSWVLDDTTCLWQAPVAYPAEGEHTWDEASQAWVEVPDEAE